MSLNIFGYFYIRFWKLRAFWIFPSLIVGGDVSAHRWKGSVKKRKHKKVIQKNIWTKHEVILSPQPSYGFDACVNSWRFWIKLAFFPQKAYSTWGRKCLDFVSTAALSGESWRHLHHGCTVKVRCATGLLHKSNKNYNCELHGMRFE